MLDFDFLTGRWEPRLCGVTAYGQRFLHMVQFLFKTFRIRRKGIGTMCESLYDTQFVLQWLVTVEIQILISVSTFSVHTENCWFSPIVSPMVEKSGNCYTLRDRDKLGSDPLFYVYTLSPIWSFQNWRGRPKMNTAIRFEQVVNILVSNKAPDKVIGYSFRYYSVKFLYVVAGPSTWVCYQLCRVNMSCYSWFMFRGQLISFVLIQNCYYVTLNMFITMNYPLSILRGQ